MSFSFARYKGRDKFRKFKLQNETKKIYINALVKNKEKTPIEKACDKIVDHLEKIFFVKDKEAIGVVDQYKHMNGFILLNPKYIAAVLAIQINDNIHIKSKSNGFYGGDYIINNNFFTEGGVWNKDILPKLQKSEKNNSREGIVIIKIVVLNYALKMFDYINNGILDYDLRSRKSNEEIEREYAKSQKDNISINNDDGSIENELDIIDENDYEIEKQYDIEDNDFFADFNDNNFDDFNNTPYQTINEDFN